jgi:RNA polymerase-binding protein DksA
MNVETQVHLTTLRGLLTFQRHELQTDLHALQQDRARMLADTATTEVTDRKDIAADEQASDISDATLERLGRELAQCEGALQRLDEERYGDCVDCGEAIPWPRLLAQPAAERCAACQRSFERGAQGTGRA